MSLGRPKARLELTAAEEKELAGFAASRSLAHALVARANKHFSTFKEAMTVAVPPPAS